MKRPTLEILLRNVEHDHGTKSNIYIFCSALLDELRALEEIFTSPEGLDKAEDQPRSH